MAYDLWEEVRLRGSGTRVSFLDKQIALCDNYFFCNDFGYFREDFFEDFSFSLFEFAFN